jgi:hypothetical protein
MTAAETSTEQLDADAIAAQFLGTGAGDARTDATKTKGPEEGSTADDGEGGEDDKSETGSADDAGGADPEADPDEEAGNEGEDADLGADPANKGPLSHLLDAYAKNPEDPKIRKRLEKILGESPRLKQELKELKEQVGKTETLPAVVVPASASSPLAHVGSVEQLEAEVQMAESWVEWCEENPDGGQYDPKNKEAVLDADGVKAQLRASRAVLRAEAGRRDWLVKLEANRAKLKATHPELFKKDSPELKALLQPVLDGRVTIAHPDYMQDLLDLQRGRREREEEARGIKKVVLDTGKAKKAAAAAKPGGAEEATDQRPGAAGGGATKKPALRPAGAGEDLATLRKRSEEGDQRAADAIARLALG